MDPLLEAVKQYLDITWQDPTLDSKINGCLKRAEKYLNRVAGADIDYTYDLRAKQLLFDCVRYIRDDAFQDFQHDWQTELNGLHADYEVTEYEQSDL